MAGVERSIIFHKNGSNIRGRFALYYTVVDLTIEDFNALAIPGGFGTAVFYEDGFCRNSF